jgi:uroporphyrinogen-III synthase
MAPPLEGRTVALAEGRQLEELAQMLEKEGATTLRCPMVSILDAPDSAPVIDWLQELIAGRFDYVVLMTGEALRRLLGFAEREGLRDQVTAALGKTRTLTRGPKPVQALKQVGLAPTKVADAPTTDGTTMAPDDAASEQLLNRRPRRRPSRQELLRRDVERLRKMVAARMDRRLAARIDPSDVVQEALLMHRG